MDNWYIFHAGFHTDSSTIPFGILQWGSELYKCVSGGAGKGMLEAGNWRVVNRKIVGNEPTLDDAFRDPESGIGFFLPLTPLFQLARSGIGIHMDGGVLYKTRGCIGLLPGHGPRFYNRLINTPISERPSYLRVERRVVTVDKIERMPLHKFSNEVFWDVARNLNHTPNMPE